MPENSTQYLGLAKKVFQHIPELRYRAGDLSAKFFNQVRSIQEKTTTNVKYIESKILETSLAFTQDNGVEINTPYEFEGSDIDLSFFVFPQKTEFVYFPSVQKDTKRSEEELNKISTLDYATILTTHSGISPEGYPLPQEGYVDWTGLSQPFAQREKASQIQHGGFFISQKSGSIEILDYDHLVAKRESHLEQGESVTEANWYMDSDNYATVIRRPNLKYRLPYNGFGYFLLPDGSKKAFTFNGYKGFLTFDKLPKADTQKDTKRYYVSPSLSEIAAYANILAKKHGALKWSIVGLEYNEGGTYTNDRFNLIRATTKDFLGIRVQPTNEVVFHRNDQRG